MIGQSIIIALIVSLAVGYLLRLMYRRYFKKSSGSGCGCGPKDDKSKIKETGVKLTFNGHKVKR